MEEEHLRQRRQSTKGQSWKCDSGVLGIAVRQRAAVERRGKELQGMSLDRLLGVWATTDHVGPCGSMKNPYSKLFRLKRISFSLLLSLYFLCLMMIVM